MNSKPKISVVVPLFNEENSIVPIYKRLTKLTDDSEFDWEFLFVDDGSQDKTRSNIHAIVERDDRVTGVYLVKNYGVTQALLAGFDTARGDYVVTMSGILEDDPDEIPHFIQKLESGFDVCIGVRQITDKPTHHKIFLKILGRLLSIVSGVKLKDYSTIFRAYRGELVKNLFLSGNVARYIPVYLKWQGARLCEVDIGYYPRSRGLRKRDGVVKSGIKTILDLMFLRFIQRYSSRPMYFFGAPGLLSLFLGIISFCVMLFYRFSGEKMFIETPLPTLSAMLVLIGIIFIALGILSELLNRIYQNLPKRKIYEINKLDRRLG